MRLRWTWTLAVGAALIGCGGDDDSSNGPSDEDSGTAGMAAGGSGGDAAGRGGSGGSGGSGMTAEPIMCGDNTCSQPMSPLAALGMGTGPAACCLEDDACGIAPSATAMTCEAPAEPDERCPDISLGALEQLADLIPGIGDALGGAGCCTESGQCGVDGATFGRGCVENAEAVTMLDSIQLPLPIPVMLSTFIMIPGARACDAPVEEDSGVVSQEDGGT